MLGLNSRNLAYRIKVLDIKIKKKMVPVKYFEMIRDYKPKKAEGILNYNSKLTEKRVLDIIDTDGEVDPHVVADYYKVHVATVRKIRAGKSWKHINRNTNDN
jgi:hypothetical protein